MIEGALLFAAGLFVGIYIERRKRMYLPTLPFTGPSEVRVSVPDDEATKRKSSKRFKF